MILELKNTTIGHNTPLLESVNASLNLGEVCLIIGNNGVGKTTLIKSILNQIPLIYGAIKINGKDISNLNYKEIAKQIAVVFSNPQIPVNHTVEDLVSLGKYIHYPYYFELDKEDKEEVNAIIQDLNLGQYKNFPLPYLSDGNLQKTFIGRALAQNSPILILDEPTTHLDEENKIITLKLLRSIAKEQNKLILFSSHDWRLAKEFADKIWYIKNKTLYAGLTEDILLEHKNLIFSHLFHFNQNFIPPKISAPDFEKKMIHSALNKHSNKDLSNQNIHFENNYFIVNSQFYFKNLTELVNHFNEK